MLDDRLYMREPSYRSALPITYMLLAANAGIYVLQAIVQFYGLFPVREYLYLSLPGLARGYVWQLVSFQFLHGSLLHLLVNLIVIYFFGRAIEEALGRRAMLQLYLLSGVVGGLCQMLLAGLVPAYFAFPVVGASAGAMGLIAAFATLFPDRSLTLLLFFVLPVSMRARTLFWISLALAVFGILVPNDNLADGAHLGGLLAGWGWVRLQARGVRLQISWWQRERRQPRLRELVRSVAAKDSRRRLPPAAGSEVLPTEDFISREVDPILDKISAQGMQSLTEQERQILDAAHARMRRRKL